MGIASGPSDKLLFAMLAVQMGFASATDLAAAASGCRGDGVDELAERLLKAGLISTEQRRAIEKAMASRVALERSNLSDPAARRAADARRARLIEELGEDAAGLPIEQEGRYEIRGVHGRGGQARVLLAWDKHMQREVALKVLREPGDGTLPGVSTQRSTSGALRFLREARVSGLLEHPNVVPVYEVGRRADGALYYTMRLVRGRTLAKALAECHGLQDRLKRLGSFWDMCNAVAFAHSRGIVHRDLKPDNVMVGEFGETVVLDWGVAKIRGERDLQARDLARELESIKRNGAGETAFGAAVGTPAYMSPEQARGQVDEIDDRSDVWGLGAVLYEILTGRPPFSGSTSAEILSRVIDQPVAPVNEISAEAPPELAAVAEKALQKDKARRYQSAKELASEIEAYMTGGRVGAYQYSSWELLKRFAAHNKPAIFAAGLILVTILVALVAVSISLRRESGALARETNARKQETAARAEEYEERLSANFHLAQAYTEKANRLEEDQLYLSAAVFASASLLHNPAHPYSPFYSPTFARNFPGSRNSRVAAASQIYRAGFDSIASLGQTLKTEDALEQVAFSPDGSLLAATEGPRVRIWDLSAKKARPPLLGHTDRAYGVAFSPDDAVLASSGRDKKIILWDASSGERLKTLDGHTDTIQSVRFSPDGRLLASGSWDKTVRLWDVSAGKLLATMSGHTDKITGVAFAPDGQSIASASHDRSVRIWSREGKLLKTIAHPDRVNGLAFSPDGAMLATACDDKRIHLWDPRSGKLLASLQGHKDSPTQLAFSRDGRLLASVSYDKTVRLWDVEERKPLLNVQAHEDFAYGVAFSPDGSTLATASYDKKVKLWYLRPGKQLVRLAGHTEVVYSLAFSTDGKRLASAGWDKTVRLWDFESMKPLRVLTGHTDSISGAIAFSPDGTLLASSSNDKTTRIWNAQTGELLHLLRNHSQTVYGTAFSPDGTLLATSSMDKTIRLWDPKSGQELKVLEGHEGVVHAVVFSPDGHLLASAGYDKTVRLWDIDTGKQLKVLDGHDDWVSGVAFSPDGRMLASSGKDGLAILWEVATGRELWRLHGHAQWVNDVRFSPDGRLLATSSDDTTVRVWSTATLETLLIIPTSREAVGIAFSPDGKSLVVGDGSDVKVYPLDFSALTADPTKLLTDAEAHAGARLNGFELERISSKEP